jgi:aspartate-semialdehyde dehydrogenase
VVGATGVVGRELLSILAKRGIAAEFVRCIASERSAGTRIPWQGEDLEVHALDRMALSGLDVVFFAAGAECARAWAPTAVEAGCVVIDNSSAFRADPSVPLVVPEVNGNILDDLEGAGVIANPNCSTIIALMAVAPIHRAAGIRRMSIATYQAVSGAGGRAMDELERQAREHAAGEPLTVDALPSQALFNVFCHESPVGSDGFNEEERKLCNESRRILESPDIEIAATCVRVGVPRAHAMAIELELERDFDASAARDLLARAPGIRIVDEPGTGRFPESRHAAGEDEVLVGRFRNHPGRSDARGLLLFAAGDQLRKGAALNAIQILDGLPVARG